MSEYLKIARQVLRERQEALPPTDESIEDILNGQALELWSDILGERLWLVVDEEDALRLGQPRGAVYTVAEARCIVQIEDPTLVAEVHGWKKQFNATVRDLHQKASG